MIEAIADTACTNTSIGSHSLAELLDVSVEEVRSKFLNNKGKLKQMETADGSYHMLVRATLLNVQLPGINSINRLPRIRCFVNLNDQPSKTPYILLGLDFLMMFNKCILQNRELTCTDFDEYKYESLIDKYSAETTNIYSLLGIDTSSTILEKSTVTALLRKAEGN